jgi:ubiquinone/menaquinone biosynthesis C-methylase UbiE
MKENTTSFHEKSYKQHANFYREHNVEEQLEKHKTFFDSGTVDAWRHLRQLDLIEMYCVLYKNASWLTVGDGAFGSSAQYIEMHGGKALATDIDVSLLKIAEENNLISDYSFANAESLDFPDDEFDFSFCKQAYHHFPRPIVGLYELLRVTKKAVILVEPADWIPGPLLRRALQFLKRKVKSLVGKSNPHTDEGAYEDVGNYVYTISEREIEKIALGMNLPCVAFQRFFDIYFDGVEKEPLHPKGALQKKIHRSMRTNSILSFFGLSHRNNIKCIIFKYMPGDDELAILRKKGFNIVRLPVNPHL